MMFPASKSLAVKADALGGVADTVRPVATSAAAMKNATIRPNDLI